MKRFDLIHPSLEPGLHLIEASAGTGKTYSIVGLILHLLLSGKHTIDSILVVTFTNAATEELHHRIRTALTNAKSYFFERLLGKSPSQSYPELNLEILQNYPDQRSLFLIKQALVTFDRCRIYTIHSFCRQLLQENAFECRIPFKPSFIESDIDILETAASDFFRKYIVHDRLASAIANEEKWTPSSIIDIYRASKRYPFTIILPEIIQTRSSLIDEINRLLREAAMVADGSPLVEQWHNDPFKKGKRPVCPNNDPKAYLSLLAGDEQSVDILFLLNLTHQNLCPTDSKKSILNLNKKFGKSYHPTEDPLVQVCDRFSSAVQKYRHYLLHVFLDEVEKRFEDEKTQKGLLAFDDLLQITYRTLIDKTDGEKLVAAVHKRISAALIDEFQDTDSVQYEIFKRLFAGKVWYIIGDPKQAIYGFRGADVYTYLRAKEDAKSHLYTLDVNYRSTNSLIRATNLLFGVNGKGQDSATRSFVTEGIEFKAVRTPSRDRKSQKAYPSGRAGSPLVWWRFYISKENPLTTTNTLLEAIKSEIVNLLDNPISGGERPIFPVDIAVLVNSNYQAATVQRALTRVGIPSVVGQTGNIFQTEEMGDLIKTLRAISRPNREDFVRAAIVNDIWGFDALSVYRINQHETSWQHLVDELNGYRDAWQHKGVMNMFESLFIKNRIGQRYLMQERGERKITNLLQSVEIAQNEQLHMQYSPEQLVDWLNRERIREARVVPQERELRLETDEDAVQVITVHKSKGLQYEVVFCPFVWEGKPIDREVPAICHIGDQVKCDFGSSQLRLHQTIAEKERLAEDMRKLYVAVTRAKQRCYLVWGISDSHQQRKSVQSSAITHLLNLHSIGSSQLESDHLPLLYDSIQTLAENHPDLMYLYDIGEKCDRSWTRKFKNQARIQTPRPNTLTSTQVATWQISSFSQLTRNIHTELPDHDELHLQVSNIQTSYKDSRFTGLVSNARVGICLHEILEEADLERIDQEDLYSLVSQKIVQFNLYIPEQPSDKDAVDPVNLIVDMLRSVVHSQLSFGPSNILFLDRISKMDSLSEWEFHFSIEHMVPDRLFEVFSSRAKGWVQDVYAPLLSQLGEQYVSGYLKGYVDLVCRQNGRFYVIDWKSNRLGDDLSDYSIESLRKAMAQHHYVLQYHLYLLALHRYLQQHQPGYQYEKHIGGVAYAFLRGIEQHPTSINGWYLDRPPFSLIQALHHELGEDPAIF